MADGVRKETVAAKGRRPSLADRLSAWWEGTDIAAEVPDAANAADNVPLPPPADPAGWTGERARAAEFVFGDGFVSPGGASHLSELLRPVAIGSSASVLDLSAGLGGGARLIARTFGAWVTGLEPSETLAGLAMQESRRTGLGKKAPVSQYDPETLELPNQQFDCILLRELLFRVGAKERLLDIVSKALRKGGALVITDFSVREPKLASPAISAWAAGEPVTPQPWSRQELVDAIAFARIEVRAADDITAAYRDMVLSAHAQLLEQRDRLAVVDRALGERLLTEAELWARRVAVLDSGDVQMSRVYGIGKLGEEALRTLSDW